MGKSSFYQAKTAEVANLIYWFFLLTVAYSTAKTCWQQQQQQQQSGTNHIQLVTHWEREKKHTEKKWMLKICCAQESWIRMHVICINTKRFQRDTQQFTLCTHNQNIVNVKQISDAIQQIVETGHKQSISHCLCTYIQTLIN